MGMKDLHMSGMVQNDFMKKNSLNCAETILQVANIDLNLGLDKNALLLAAGFGGGMGIGNVCGALTGSLMVLGRLYVKNYAHESTRIKDIEKKFIDAFEQEYKTILCTPIKDAHADPEYKCKSVVLKAAEILENILKTDPPEGY